MHSPGEKKKNKDRDKEKSKTKGNANTVALMGLNINGNSISFGETAWKGGLRPRQAYNTPNELQDGYNKFFS